MPDHGEARQQDADEQRSRVTGFPGSRFVHFAYAPAIEIDLSITALPYVRDGLGIAIVDSLLPWEQFNGVVTRPFEPRIEVPIAILTSNDRPLSPSHELMRDCLRAACRALNRSHGT